MFCPCVLPVFCEAEVDWLVVAFEFMRTELLLPLKPRSDSTPVAAFGFTDWIGLVCALWLASVAWRGPVCATAAVLKAAKTAAAITLVDCFMCISSEDWNCTRTLCSFYAPVCACSPRVRNFDPTKRG